MDGWSRTHLSYISKMTSKKCPDVPAGVAGGRLEDRARHPEHAGIPAGDDGHLLPVTSQVEREASAVHLDGVARRVSLQAGALRDAVDVRCVTDDVVDARQGGGDFGGDPVGWAGAEADDEQLGGFPMFTWGTATGHGVPTMLSAGSPC